MTFAARHPLSLRTLCLLILASGFATLSWEVVWQIKSTLALGVSAWGTAITLAVTMGGMSIGGFVMGHALRNGTPIHAVRVYGVLEIVIGLAGLCLGSAFAAVETLDTWAYAALAGDTSWVHILGIVAVLGVPTMCMGATLPVFGLIAKQFNISIAQLYGINTLGAATGVMVAALALIPWLGVTHTVWVIAAINLLVGACAWVLAPDAEVAAERDAQPDTAHAVSWPEVGIVAVTGFATFALEIAWFRALAAALPNTTDVFAILLASVLCGLGLAARYVPVFKRKRWSLGGYICLAGVLILLANPLIEHFDIVIAHSQAQEAAAAHVTAAQVDAAATTAQSLRDYVYLLQIPFLFLIIFCLIAPPMMCLGLIFPWILDNQDSSRRVGKLYAVNTFAAIIGAIGTAWFLLPAIGFAKTAWLAGALVLVTGMLVLPGRARFGWAGAGIAALLVSVYFETGVGHARVQGVFGYKDGKPAKVLEAYNGPEATVSVVEYDDGGRRLIIDSSSAAGESPDFGMGEHYMSWMGHLPMLLQADPKNALIICFGTGQTANAVRRENPQSVDIVDINPRIFRLAHNFRSNQNVLDDPRVHPIVMDGRAYMRRATKTYDVITLEPMPPNNAGVNALYSKEFYELARQRLSDHGVIAQWLPFHTLTPHSAASIARTFTQAFPNAILWLDPVSKEDGILLGTKDGSAPFGTHWPGFARTDGGRNLTREEVLRNVVLDRQQLAHYAQQGDIVTDDNQLLAYGRDLYISRDKTLANFTILRRFNSKVSVP